MVVGPISWIGWIMSFLGPPVKHELKPTTALTFQSCVAHALNCEHVIGLQVREKGGLLDCSTVLIGANKGSRRENGREERSERVNQLSITPKNCFLP